MAAVVEALEMDMRPMDKMKEVFYNKANKSGQG